MTYPLATYSTVATATASSTIDFINPCLAPFTFVPKDQTDPAPDNFSGSTITFTLAEFELTPSRCEMEYTCTGVERTDGDVSKIACSNLGGILNGVISNGQLTISADSDDYQNGTFTPGQYEVSIKGSAKGSSPLQEATKTFIIALVDPCDPPISVTGTDFTNQEYTLTDNQKEYTHPAFTVSPEYCPIVFTITETLLTAGDSAIVNDITGVKTGVTTF